MIAVVDASAVLEVLLQTDRAALVARRLFRAGENLVAPHLLDVKVAQVLRRYQLRGELDDARGRIAIADLKALTLHRYPHEFLIPRVWELRENLTAYDAVYVALAEVLEAPLVTCDFALAGAPGNEAVIELVID